MKIKSMTSIILTLLVFFVNNYGQVSYKFNTEKNAVKTTSVNTEKGISYVQLNMHDLPHIEQVGAPNLPVKFIQLIIPPQEDVDNISYNVITSHSSLLENKIFPTQHLVKIEASDSKTEFVDPDPTIYNSSDPWPKNIVEVVSDGYFDGNNHIVTLKIIPFQYLPLKNELKIITDLDINLSLSPNNKEISLPKWRSVKTQEIMDKALNSIVANKDKISSYQIKPKTESTYSKSKQGLNKTTAASIPPVEFYEYVIITSTTLKPYFDNFVAWKKRKGIDIGVVTTSSIYNEYTGDYVSNLFDNAGKIRQFLRDFRELGGVWVLLAGDFSVVPVRYGCGWNTNTWNRYTTDDYKIPADNYYADFNGDWNVDGDEWLGQPYSDNPDYYPDFYVGRLLCTTGSEVSNWSQKTLKYEQNPGNGNNSYVMSSFLTESDELQRDNMANNIASRLPTFTHTILRELPTYNASNPYFPMGYDVINQMNSSNYGFCSWLAHGTPIGATASSNGVNTSPWNSIVPSNATGNNGSLDNLSNFNYPGINYSLSCDNAPFDDYDPSNWGWGVGYNMAEAYTVQSLAGGIAFLGDSRYGWLGSSYYLLYKFIDQINAGHTNLGVAELLSKANYTNHYLNYSHNLVGDPEVQMWTATPNNYSNVSIGYTENMVNVTVNAINNQNTICASSKDNGLYYWSVAHNVNSYTFNTSVRPLYITITRSNYLPYMALIGGSTSSSIVLSENIHLFGSLMGEENAQITIRPNTKIILEDGNSREFENEIILNGKDINNLASLVKFGVENDEENTKDAKLPNEYELLGNYPNPFNPSTTIKYSIPEISDVKIEVFSITGGKVTEYISKDVSAGYHNYIWSGKNSNGVLTSSGIYLYRLTAVSNISGKYFQTSSKMILLR